VHLFNDGLVTTQVMQHRTRVACVVSGFIDYYVRGMKKTGIMLCFYTHIH
jgi:hypothetical protein